MPGCIPSLVTVEMAFSEFFLQRPSNMTEGSKEGSLLTDEVQSDMKVGVVVYRSAVALCPMAGRYLLSTVLMSSIHLFKLFEVTTSMISRAFPLSTAACGAGNVTICVRRETITPDQHS